MTHSDIVTKVRALLNECGDAETTSLLSEDCVRVDDYIAKSIPDALLFVQKHTADGEVNVVAALPSSLSITDAGDGTGFVLLPDDYVMLRVLRMNGWARACTQAFSVASPLYRAQQNLNTRAGSEKPVCIENRNTAGARILEYYSTVAGVRPSVNTFIYEARYNAAQGLRCNDRLALAVCYMCASLVLAVFENTATAAAMERLSLALMDNN